MKSARTFARTPPPVAPSPLAGRASGVLLHPTSLPGPYGVGDLGPAAHQWVERLAKAGQRYWQILPLGPTGYGDSPYAPLSSFAGNPTLISPDALVADGLLSPGDVRGETFADGFVDYARVISFKDRLLGIAHERFAREGRGPARGKARAGTAAGRRARALRRSFDAFCRANGDWLDDYALYAALKRRHGERPYHAWGDALRRRDPAALNAARHDLRDVVDRVRFEQFLFARQWAVLKAFAAGRGVRVIGDLPIFVALDSADVWASPGLFLLRGPGEPSAVAGVGPDAFTADGQLWGNPHYDWPAHARDGFKWWGRRVRHAMAQVDLVRIDHFRGLEAAWHVRAGAATAKRGRWVKGPGAALFDALRVSLRLTAKDALPFIAEDLGVITPPVHALRDRFGLPGMRILQFAFGSGPDNPFLPHHHAENAVVYTGTHDNDTTRGWFDALPPNAPDRAALARYLGRARVAARDVSWDLIRLALASVARLAIVPAQDLLGQGTRARMNTPGTTSGNWRWRLNDDRALSAALARLADLTTTYGRDARWVARRAGRP